MEIEPLAHLDYPATGIDPGLPNPAAPAPTPVESAVSTMSAEEVFNFQQMAASTLESVQITTTPPETEEIPGLPQGAVVLDAANPEAPPLSDATATGGYYQIPAFREYQETGNFFTDMANLPYNKVCRALNTAVDIANMPLHDVQYIGEHGWHAYGEAALEANINGFKQLGYSLMDTVQSGMDFVREAPKQTLDSFVFKEPGEILADTYTYCKESLTSVGAWDQAIDMAFGAMAFKKVGGPSATVSVGVVDDVTVGVAPKSTFKNLAPDDVLGTPKLLDINKIITQKISKKLDYVVTEDGKLILGARSRLPGGGHIDLARGKPVQAAGEVQFVNGKIKFINNKSGHYQPSGESAKNATLKAFGVDDASLYIEKKF